MKLVPAELLDLPPVHVQHGAGSADLLALYERYLDGHGLLGKGFAFREIVKPDSPRHALPPAELWHRMVPTLALAHVVREAMKDRGARGLRIAAAYRPAGGEADSVHKVNGALDLDLLPGDGMLADELAEVVAEVWAAHRHLEMGAGTYAPDGRLWTNRVHIDTGFRHRCWQGTGRNAAGRYTWAARPAVLRLASAPAVGKAQVSPEARPGAVS